jgi:hypothetical protein
MLSLERYGFIIVIALLYMGVLNGLFQAVQTVAQELLGYTWLVLAFA